MSETTYKFAPEVRARAVRMVLDHDGDYLSRWAALVSIAEKIWVLGARIPMPMAAFKETGVEVHLEPFA